MQLHFLNATPDIDECEGNPCQNGATCTDIINGYKCSCKAGYSGITCETGMTNVPLYISRSNLFLNLLLPSRD